MIQTKNNLEFLRQTGHCHYATQLIVYAALCRTIPVSMQNQATTSLELVVADYYQIFSFQEISYFLAGRTRECNSGQQDLIKLE